MSQCSRLCHSSQRHCQKRRGGEKLQKRLLDSVRSEVPGKIVLSVEQEGFFF